MGGPERVECVFWSGRTGAWQGRLVRENTLITSRGAGNIAAVLVLLGGWGVAIGFAQPRLTLSQERWDFGDVWHPESVTLALRVSNTGDAPLNIANVRSTCGCTVVQPAKKVLAPGEYMDVPVRFDTAGKQDRVTSSVIFETDDPQRPSVTLAIAGNVKRAIRREPLGGLVIRTLDGRPGQMGVVLLENLTEQPLQLQLTATSAPWLDVQVQPVVPGVSVQLVGRTREPLRPGESRRGSLRFSTGLTREPSFDLPVRVEALPLVYASPPAIMLDERISAQPTTRMVSLHYYGTREDFAITQTTSSSPLVTVRVLSTQPPTGGMAQLTPKIMRMVQTQLSLPGFADLPVEGVTVTFETNDPAMPRVDFIVTRERGVWEKIVYGEPAGPMVPAR